MQPELLRFPGLWRTRMLIGAGLFAAGLTAALVWEFGNAHDGNRVHEFGLLAVLAVWLSACWPREIVCGPAGVEQYRLFGLGKVRVPWSEVLGIEQGRELLGAGAKVGLATGTIAVIGASATIRHSPRHPDPERFLRECRMRMEEWEARHRAAGRSGAPAAAGEEKR